MQKRRTRTGLTVAICGVAAMLLTPAPVAVAQEKVMVFAAASLKNALDAVNAACAADVG